MNRPGKLPLDLNECFGRIKAPLRVPFPPKTLSVVMIVKDEKDNIEKAVESFRPVADEIVVNDTGSTDGTQKILERLGVQWFQTSWQNDFSLARNQSIERAGCSWILWMDADDRIPSDQVVHFNKLKTAPLDRIFGFQVINTQAGQPLGARFMQPRMFPNHPELRFERRIHEQVVLAAARMGLYMFHTETTIYHTGYEDEGKKREKARRNLRLAELEKEHSMDDPAFSMSIGDSSYIIEEWEKGIAAYKKTWDIPNLKRINKDIHAAVPTYIGMGYQKLKQYAEAIGWFDQAHALSPDKLEPVHHKGECLSAMGRDEDAMACYRKVLDMPLVFTSTANQYDAVRIFSYHYLSVLLMKYSRHGEAITLLEKMHETYPQIIETWNSLGDCYAAVGNPDKAIACWKHSITIGPGKTPDVYTRLLDMLHRERREDETEQVLAQARAAVPGFSWRALQVKTHSGGKVNASLCMIVKNEESVLGNCLSSVEGLFEEIIIADTGSVDRTMDVASRYGARIIQTPWKDDFSAARNVSIDAACGRWVMWFDADDIVLPEDKEKIHSLLKRPPEKAYGFLVKSSPDRGVTGSMFNQIRLFPNRPNVRFRSPVHEQVLPALEGAGIPVEYTEIKIIHTGYADPQVARRKQIRNKAILGGMIERGEGVTPVTLYTYAHACMDLDDNETALEYFLQAVELAENTNTDPHIIRTGPPKAATALAKMKRFEEARNVLQVGLNQPEIESETILLKAQVEAADGSEDEAYQWYARLLDLRPKPTFIPVDFELLKIKALDFMGRYWHKRGNDPLAKELLMSGLAIKQGKDFMGEDLKALHRKYSAAGQ